MDGKVFPVNTRILIVDDSSTARVMLKKILMDMGYQNLTFAKNGKEATALFNLQVASGEPFELIFSDMKMPEMTGVQFLASVRRGMDHPQTPFIMATAQGDKASIIDAIKLKVNGYMVKPISASIVQDRMEKVWKALPPNLKKTA